MIYLELYQNHQILFHQLLSNIILNIEVMKLLYSIASLNKGRNYLYQKKI